ncbi:DUF1294 domain-containing protein [Cytobacillus sp. Hz8]|uniref:DUF1294 domain-containing protein n=1 Tax=Cytobacillus sp. Hz8 TaxID=3347168 RepID=UPI0035D6E1FB
MLLYFAVYFLAINIIGLMVMLIDKRRAIHHQYRIPEKNIVVYYDYRRGNWNNFRDVVISP